jgi:hypothetical protein
MLPTKFVISSRDSKLSAYWLGVNADIEVRKVYQMSYDGDYITVSVSIKNTGSVATSNLYCKSPFLQLL